MRPTSGWPVRCVTVPSVIKRIAKTPVTGRRVRLFNPRRQQWKRHFQWSADGTEIIGRTVCGRATVAALHLNSDLAVLVRTNWIKAGWHPPTDA